MLHYYTVIVFITAALSVLPGPALARTEAEQDCYAAVSGAIAAQRAWSRQGFEVANSTLGQTTDGLFNLDCLKDISLAGGINLYGLNLLDVLKKKLCDFANQQIDKVNARTRQQFDLPHGLGGISTDAGLRSDGGRARQPAVRRPSASVSGRAQAGLKGVQTRTEKNTNGFSRLEDFFR